MKKIMVFPLDDGQVYVEVEEEPQLGMRKRGPDDIVEKAKKNFNGLIDGIQPIVASLAAQMTSIATKVDVELTVGLKVSAGGSFILVSGGAEAILMVKLTWKGNPKDV